MEIKTEVSCKKMVFMNLFASNTFKNVRARIVSQKVLDNIISCNLQGLIVSIYDRSFNIETYSRFIINVGIDKLPLSPRSILVSVNDFYNLILPKIYLNLPVICSYGSIYMPDIKLCISTKTTPKFNPKLELSRNLLPDSKIKENLIEASRWVKHKRPGMNGLSPSPLSGYFFLRYSFINKNDSKQIREMKSPPQTKSSFILLFGKTLWTRIDSLLYAIRQNAWADVLREVRGILGFGPGLTPSGDDFLAGFVSVAVILAGVNQEIDELVSNIVRIVGRESKGRTTDVSISMIEDACNGEIAEPAINFIRASLQTDNSDQIRIFTKQLISIGGSSGEDLFNGIATGIWFFKGLATNIKSQYQNCGVDILPSPKECKTSGIQKG